MRTILIVAAGGCLGALARYGLSRFIAQIYPSSFPLGTFIINVTGSFAIGFLFEISERFAISPDVRAFIAIGFLGAYTTFSTYALESINLVRDGELRLFLTNILLSNIAGLFAVIFGIYIARFLIKNF